MASYTYGGDSIYTSTAVGSGEGTGYQIVPSRDDDVSGDKFECSFWATQTFAGSSTPTMDLTLQFSADGTNWCDGASFTQLTSSVLTKNEFKVPTVQGKYVRVKRTASGTISSYTGSVKILANGKFKLVALS